VLFKYIKANWDGKVSEKLLRQWLSASSNKNSEEVDKMLKNIENKHRLVRKGEDFVMNLRVENGEVLLNDQPLTLKDLKF
jgi:Ca2+-binding EF-hand superfamily protein